MDADAFNAFEGAGWQSKAAGYDDFFGRITTRVIEPLLEAAGVGAGTRLLDVASGPGYVAARAAGRGATVVGIDIAEAMISLARRLHPELEFRAGDAEALAFADESFDAVVGNFLLLHLGRPEQAAAEFARVLAPGGRLGLTVWDVPERARFIGVVVDAVVAAGAGPPADLPAGPPIFRFSDDAELTGHVEASPDSLWRGLLGGTVRVSALVLRQPEDVQREIRAAFDRGVEEYIVGGRLELPVSVKLASGRRAQPGTRSTNNA